MANNRMFLVHVPSGKAVFLAKNMAAGWYGVPSDIKARLENFFNEEDVEFSDDFSIAMEESPKNPFVLLLEYIRTKGNNGLHLLKTRKS